MFSSRICCTFKDAVLLKDYLYIYFMLLEKHKNVKEL